MGRCYIKIDRDQDAYAEWSSVVDTVIRYGTREEMIAANREEFGTSNEHSCLSALARADETGSSATAVRFGDWADDELHVMEGGGPGTLRRADLQRYCELMVADEVDEAEIAKLITPHVYDDE